MQELKKKRKNWEGGGGAAEERKQARGKQHVQLLPVLCLRDSFHTPTALTPRFCSQQITSPLLGSPTKEFRVYLQNLNRENMRTPGIFLLRGRRHACLHACMHACPCFALSPSLSVSLSLLGVAPVEGTCRSSKARATAPHVAIS